MRYLLVLSVLLFGCLSSQKLAFNNTFPFDESQELLANESHDNERMRYKLIQSKVVGKDKLFNTISAQLEGFNEAKYQNLLPMILEQDIPTIQASVSSGKLTYKQLTQWYLYRILKFESDKDKSLYAIISINPNAVEQAAKCDANKNKMDHPIYGMPILLKDNVNTSELPTTAGAVALQNNNTDDATIVKNIKAKGGIILGKLNLSEWAYYFCQGCPLGYSAIGGQSLNPYGRMKFETGGSSAGSGTSMAANYSAAAIGTETSGSILSPSSKNSVVGLKPTIGLVSRSGIVPISSTLDTAGPMCRSVVDNAILLSAIVGDDENDLVTMRNSQNEDYWKSLGGDNFKGKKFGVNKNFLEIETYKNAIAAIKTAGGEIYEIEPQSFNYEGFTTFLNAEMKRDLPAYLNKYASKNLNFDSVQDLVNFNKQDSTVRAPYGQFHFEATANESISKIDFIKLKRRFRKDARNYFDTPIDKYDLDAVLSINNYEAGIAAMAQYPALTVPMGYTEVGEPISLTFIAKQFEEQKLLEQGYIFEQLTKHRKLPQGFE